MSNRRMSLPLPICSRYLFGWFLRRGLQALAGISAVLLVFDLLAHAETVTANRSDVIWPLLRYSILRLPEIIQLILPLAVLTGALVVLAQAITRRELVILYAGGVSAYRYIRIFWAGGLVFAALALLLSEVILPTTAPLLRNWKEAGYAAGATAPTHPVRLWLHTPDGLIHVGRASDDGRTLYALRLLTNAESAVQEQGSRRYIRASEAIYLGDGQWRLQGVHVHVLKNGKQLELADQRMGLRLRPALLALLRSDLQELTAGQLLTLYRSGVHSEKPRDSYRLWLHRRAAGPVAVLVMILLAVPLGLQVTRRAQLLAGGLGCIAAGFVYVFISRFLFALGLSGALPPVVAVWSPVLLFSAAAFILLLHYHERPM